MWLRLRIIGEFAVVTKPLIIYHHDAPVESPAINSAPCSAMTLFLLGAWLPYRRLSVAPRVHITLFDWPRSYSLSSMTLWAPLRIL